MTPRQATAHRRPLQPTPVHHPRSSRHFGSSVTSFATQTWQTRIAAGVTPPSKPSLLCLLDQCSTIVASSNRASASGTVELDLVSVPRFSVRKLGQPNIPSRQR